jgi:hypothetical protein
MGIAISIGSGLLLGIGLMIWGLVERKKRYEAEKKAMRAEDLKRLMKIRLENTLKQVEASNEDKKKAENQIGMLRGTIDKLRDRLKECKDPETIKNWLEEELGGQI